MSNVPPVKPRAPYLSWCVSHAGAWKGDPAAVGLTTTMADDYLDVVNAATGAVALMEDAKEAYRASVRTAAEAMRTLQRSTGDNVRTIRAFAEINADPAAVYAAAQIDPPAPPSPLPAPGTPGDFTVTLNPVSGAITIKWKCANPGSGTAYVIKRRLNSTGPWTFLGVSGGSDKSFTDTTFVAGPDSVQYSVQGLRGSVAGTEAMVSVNFGSLNGQMTATIAPSSPARLAA